MSGNGGLVSPVSEDVGLGQSFTLSITPDSGYAVSTISIDGNLYINNGVSEPPANSTWLTVVLTDVNEPHTIIVTFDTTSDSSGIADKYKLTVNASAGTGGQVSPKTQKVVSGSDAAIDITPDAGMAVDTITANDVEYVNDGKV